MKTFFNSTILVVAMIVTGCSGKSDSPLEKAGKMFSQGDYETALIKYESLIASEGSTARVGAGWCNLRLNHLSEANQYFADAALDSLPDGYAGWSFVLWANGSVSQAIDKANFVLRKEPNFRMSLDSRVDADQIVWIQASSYYQLGNYAAAVERIQQLDASFNPSLSAPNIAQIIGEKLTSLGAISY